MKISDVIVPNITDVIERANFNISELDKFIELLQGVDAGLVHELAMVRNSLKFFLKKTDAPDFSVVSFDLHCYRAELWIKALKWSEKEPAKEA